MKLHVPEMSCGHCTAAITKSVKASDPAAQVETDLESHTVQVETRASQAEVLAAIKSAGYEVTPV